MYDKLEEETKSDPCEEQNDDEDKDSEGAKFFHGFVFGVFLMVCLYFGVTYYSNSYEGDYPYQFGTTKDIVFPNLTSSIYLWNFPEHIADVVKTNGSKGNATIPHSPDLCQIDANDTTTWNSMIHSNFSVLKKYDVVVFYIPTLDLSNLPPVYYKQPEHQRYIFYTDESPASMSHLYMEDLDNYFNWMMSYRSDSDLQLLPRQIKPIDNKISTRAEHLPLSFNQKQKKVAWIVSDCNGLSNNEEYVRELREHIDVDIYGSCGNLTTKPVPSDCFRRDGTRRSIKTRCLANLTKDHKFYLSFEDSDCQDYVTDKFFNVLRRDLIPIVKGGANYSSFAPPRSFINTARYKSPAHLAKYLNHLDKDKGMFTSRYFEWKQDYSVGTLKSALNHDFRCNLCDRIREAKGIDRRFKVVESDKDNFITEYWFGPNQVERKSYISPLPMWSAVDQCN